MMEREEAIKKDATSKETLEDLEENEDLSTGDSEGDDLPSPDGAFDEPQEKSQADPM